MLGGEVESAFGEYTNLNTSIVLSIYFLGLPEVINFKLLM
jgi:hypothetical protein